MDKLDGIGEVTLIEELSAKITAVLMSPVNLLWNEWASKNIPVIIQNILLFVNSIFWGIAIEYIYTRIKRGR